MVLAKAPLFDYSVSRPQMKCINRLPTFFKGLSKFWAICYEAASN